jgi:glutamate N-acetyltransferase/amino-acid N-acetyltransferase
VARQLAQAIVKDGEGVTRVAEVRVEGARTAAEADRIARVVGESPLVKTALHGGDPNWGRVLAAVGRAGVPLDVERISIWIGEVHVAERGAAREYEEKTAAAAMLEDPVRLRIRLGEGEASGWVWTTDLSRGYVDINAHYRS